MHLPYSALTGLFDQLRQPSKSSQPTNNVGRQIKTKLPTNVREIPGGTAGTAATIAEMQRLAREASTDPHWVSWCRTVVSDLPSKDYEAEARRIYDVVKKNVRYVLDPRGLELVQDPRYIMFVDGSGDCFAEGTLLLKDDHTFVCVSKIKEGDKIWGRDKWTTVTKTWNKGYLPTWKITLNNGSSVRLTPDHKVWVGDEVKKVCEIADETLVSPVEDPIWDRPRQPLHIEEIDKDNLVVPCYDLATEDQQIYLPEADWVVHNCDEHSTLIAAMALSLGHEAAFKTIAADPDRPEEFSHVYPLIGIQKGAETWWYSADTTQPGGYFGWEPPKEAVLKEKVWPV